MNWLIELIASLFRPKPTPVPPVPPSGDWRTTLLNLHNAQRSKNGIPLFVMDDKLNNAAQLHTNWMSTNKKLDHNEGFVGPGQRMTAQGYRWRSWGENIAWGQRNEQNVMTSWMNSPGHRGNILNKNFVNVGFGRSTDNYWTVDFGKPS